MGVVVRRCIDILTIIINFPYSTCINFFLAAASLLICSFFKCFFGLVVYEAPLLILRAFHESYTVYIGPWPGSIIWCKY